MLLDKLIDSKIWIKIKHPFNSKKRRTLYNIRQKQIFKKYAYEALKSLNYAIDSYPHNTEIWLEFGTLLGAYREKQLIAHDYDLDFGITYEHLNEDFIKHLEKFNFRPISKFEVKSSNKEIDGYIAEYTFIFKNIINVDFFAFQTKNDEKKFFFFDTEDGLTWEETYAKYNNHLRTKTKKISNFNLIKSTFLDLEFYFPDNVETHLKEIYGPDFMIPKQYSFTERPKDLEILFNEETLGLRTFF